MEDAYDLANVILITYDEHSEEYQKAKIFIEKYEELEAILNPIVLKIIDLETDFIKNLKK